MDPVTERRHLFEQVGVQFQEAEVIRTRIKVRELCEETACLYEKTRLQMVCCGSFSWRIRGGFHVKPAVGRARSRGFYYTGAHTRSQRWCF